LLVANSFWLLDLFAHIKILVGGCGWVGSAVDLNRYGRKTNVLPNDNGSFDQGVAGVIVACTAGNIFKLLVADRLWLLDFFAHIKILVGGCGWVGSAVDLNRYGRKTNVLPNDNGSFDQGVAGVIVACTAGNIFKLLVADRLGFLDFFAHGSGFLLVSIWLVWV
jgi:hypothetical protein